MNNHKLSLSIIDANILIDYVLADEDIIRELSNYWKEVLVPDCVINEVDGLTLDRAAELGLVIVETPFSELKEDPVLSYQDLSCFYYTKKHSAVCLTNDKALRRACKSNGLDTIWGLEMLLLLVSNSQIKKARAKGIAEKIHKNNPEITGNILKDFLINLQNI
jgi:rRNA-processing protein FCF1